MFLCYGIVEYNTDDLHTHDTDSDFHMKNIDTLGDWDTSGRSDRNYDSSALPGNMFHIRIDLKVFKTTFCCKSII